MIIMSLYGRERDYDVFEDDSDDTDMESSSEDEIDIILHGTPEQKRKLKHLYTAQKSGATARASKENESQSSEDDFEKEMNAELDLHVRGLEDARRGVGQAATPSSSTDVTMRLDKTGTAAEEFYDDVYFDSDEEQDDETKRKGKPKHAVISNDDLLYDPNLDDVDQKWVDRQRMRHRKGGGKSSSKKREKKPNSDALLDCPACLTTLCIDCQRHDLYKHQYRAMFVMNCTPDHTESLECPEQATKKQKKKKKKSSNTPSSQSDAGVGGKADLFHPVKCNECDTVVGVIDSDEVYHFFNILASHT